MLEFDNKGFLKPYTSITCNLNELKKAFVDDLNSDVRKKHFENYLKYNKELKELLGVEKLRQWLDGSFVSKSFNPSDIDIVTFINHTHSKKYGEKLIKFGKAGSIQAFQVDAYLVEVFPEGEKDHFRTEYDMKEWHS